MILLGELALWIALPIGIWGAVAGFVGGRKGRGDLVLSAEYSVYAVFFLLALTSAGIMTAFLTDQFQFWYVANYSNRELPTFYKVSGPLGRAARVVGTLGFAPVPLLFCRGLH